MSRKITYGGITMLISFLAPSASFAASNASFCLEWVLHPEAIIAGKRHLSTNYMIHSI